MAETVPELLGSLAETFSPSIAARNQRQREFEAQQQNRASEAESRKNKIQLEFAKDFLDNLIERGGQPQDAPPEIQQVFARNNIDLSSLTLPNKDDDKFNTDFGKAFQDIDRLEAAAVEAERSGDSKRADALMERAGLLRKNTLDSLNEKPDVEFRDLGDRVGIFSKDGTLIRSERKGRLPGSGVTKPDVRTVRVNEDGEAVIRQFDVSQPSGAEAFRQAILGGGIETTLPSGNSRTRRITFDENNRPIIEDTNTGNFGGVDRSVGERNPIAKTLNTLEGAMVQLLELDKRIRPEDVGLRGAVKEEVLNRGIAAFAEFVGVDSESLVDADFVKNRSFMRLVAERLQRVVQDQPDRFSNQDVARLDDMLTRPRARMTFAEYKAQIATVIQFFDDKRLMASNQLGRKTVLDMSLQELKAEAQKYAATNGKEGMNPDLAKKVAVARFSEEEIRRARNGG